MAEARKTLDQIEFAIESAGSAGLQSDRAHKDLERVLETLRTPISTQEKGEDQLRREQAALLTRAVLALRQLQNPPSSETPQKSTPTGPPNNRSPLQEKPASDNHNQANNQGNQQSEASWGNGVQNQPQRELGLPVFTAGDLEMLRRSLPKPSNDLAAFI